jgi:hypothetical protein
MLNLFTGTVKVFFLQLTPSWIMMLFIISICALFADSGIKTFASLIQLLIILSLMNFFGGFSLSFIKDFHIGHITPIFDTSLPDFIKGTLITAGTTSECLLFFMVMVRSIPDPHKHYRWVVKGLLFWAFTLSFAVFIMAGVVTPGLLARVAQAGVTVTRVIQIDEFIRGMEILLLGTYQFITIGKVMMYLYSSQAAAQKFFNVKGSRFQLLFVALLAYIGSIW